MEGVLHSATESQPAQANGWAVAASAVPSVRWAVGAIVFAGACITAGILWDILVACDDWTGHLWTPAHDDLPGRDAWWVPGDGWRWMRPSSDARRGGIGVWASSGAGAALEPWSPSGARWRC